jgi:hypothetical protein
MIYIINVRLKSCLQRLVLWVRGSKNLKWWFPLKKSGEVMKNSVLGRVYKDRMWWAKEIWVFSLKMMKIELMWRVNNRFCANQTNALFAWLISHQPTVLFSQNKPTTSNQPAVPFSHNKPAPIISHHTNELYAARCLSSRVACSTRLGSTGCVLLVKKREVSPRSTGHLIPPFPLATPS